MLKNNNLKIYYVSILRLAKFSFIELTYSKKKECKLHYKLKIYTLFRFQFFPNQSQALDPKVAYHQKRIFEDIRIKKTIRIN